MFQDLAIVAVLAIVTPTVSLIADEEFLLQQKTVYELLLHIDQPEISGNGSYYELGMSYNIGDNIKYYNNEESVRKFLAHYERGMQPRGKVFSPFYPELLEEAKDLCRVFMNAQDFETLNKTAAWARIHMNEGMFAYAFSIAVIHHKTTSFIRVPAVHEIQPHLFFSEKVIQMAQRAMREAEVRDTYKSPEGYVVIPATYGYQPNIKNYDYQGDEERLNYFRNDVSLAEVMHYAHLLRPFWLCGIEFSDDVTAAWPPRGDTFLWWHMHTLALYNMERLSNDLGPIREFDWNYPLPYGHHPKARYPNGCRFPSRKRKSRIRNYLIPLLNEVREIESRISVTLDTGKIMGTDGVAYGELKDIHKREFVDCLGNMLEGNADSPNQEFYGSYDALAKRILGCATRPKTKHSPCPSTLEHYATGHRDPMYWSLTQRMVNIYHKFASRLSPYTQKDLEYEGVTITSVEVDEIFTYFESVDHLVSTGLEVDENGEDEPPVVKVNQCRLSHKPYSYRIMVESAKETTGWVRVFLGPKQDFNENNLDMSDNYKNFLLLDAFAVKLDQMNNTIHRSSTQAYPATPENISGDLLYEKVISSLKDVNDTFEIPQNLYYLQLRTTIPKGWPNGLPLQLFVYISSPIEEFNYTRLTLRKSIIFPLDRPPMLDLTNLTNAYLTNVKIYHKEYSINKITKTRKTNCIT